jgi:hypothetical protein
MKPNKPSGMGVPPVAKRVRSCRRCGCTNERPCIDFLGIPCAWTRLGDNLCTACASRRERERKLKRMGILPSDYGYDVSVLRIIRVSIAEARRAIAECTSINLLREAVGLCVYQQQKTKTAMLRARIKQLTTDH